LKPDDTADALVEIARGFDDGGVVLSCASASISMSSARAVPAGARAPAHSRDAKGAAAV
jgi:hypothetical protein